MINNCHNLNKPAVFICLLALLPPAHAETYPLQVPCFQKDELASVLKEKFGETFTGETFPVTHSKGDFNVHVYANTETGGFHMVGFPQDTAAHDVEENSACIMDAKPQGYPEGPEFEQYRSILVNNPED